MEFEYEETTEDLQTRIDIHNQYGGRDIDAWMLDLLKPEKGSVILDVGCGAGKQLQSFYEYLEGETQITGGDVNPELLEQARALNTELDNPLKIMELDFNQRFPLDEDQFDLESCCFAIYYAADIPFTIREMHRVLKPGGRLFTTGPMPENKQLFYEIIQDATGRPIPPMPGSSRYNFEIREAIGSTFSQLEVHIFENPLVFKDAEPFLAYTRASLSEDRKLWGGFFSDGEEFEAVMEKITDTAQKRVEAEGELVMTKVVGGFIATK